MKVLFSVLMASSVSAMAQDIKLIGGRPAKPGEFPASVYASSGGSRCSATVVGEKVLFIAAHCVSNGGTTTFSVGQNRYSGRCTHSADYRRDSTADWALCALDKVVTGIPYEVVNTDASIHKVGGQVQLTGYGCTVQGGSGGNDGIYRVGEASITRLPTSTSNDIITKGNVALCYGDSGGSAFQYLDTAKTKRVLISINSRGDIKTTSYLSSVSTPKAKQFIQDWTSRQGLRMCGVHADAKGCRDSGPVFELPQVCVDAKAKSDLLASCMFDETTPGMSECRDAMDLTSACVEARQQ